MFEWLLIDLCAFGLKQDVEFNKRIPSEIFKGGFRSDTAHKETSVISLGT